MTAAKPSAITKLVSGPATATIAMPCFGCLKLRGTTGMGLAQPKMKPVPLK